MSEISKEYLLLFNTITKTELALQQMRQELIAAQQQAEALFLEDVSDDTLSDVPTEE